MWISTRSAQISILYWQTMVVLSGSCLVAGAPIRSVILDRWRASGPSSQMLSLLRLIRL